PRVTSAPPRVAARRDVERLPIDRGRDGLEGDGQPLTRLDDRIRLHRQLAVLGEQVLIADAKYDGADRMIGAIPDDHLRRPAGEKDAANLEAGALILRSTPGGPARREHDDEPDPATHTIAA